jgi:hypothetical protein
MPPTRQGSATVEALADIDKRGDDAVRETRSSTTGIRQLPPIGCGDQACVAALPPVTSETSDLPKLDPQLRTDQKEALHDVGVETLPGVFSPQEHPVNSVGATSGGNIRWSPLPT